MKQEVTRKQNSFTITTEKVVKNTFGNKRIVPITETFTLEDLNKRINLLKKQLTELIDKKKLVKQHIKGELVEKGVSSPKPKEKSQS